jgi:hypothetical protein
MRAPHPVHVRTTRRQSRANAALQDVPRPQVGGGDLLNGVAFGADVGNSDAACAHYGQPRGLSHCYGFAKGAPAQGVWAPGAGASRRTGSGETGHRIQ